MMSEGEIIIKFFPNGESFDFDGHLHDKDRRRAIQMLKEMEMEFEGDYETCTECDKLKSETSKEADE